MARETLSLEDECRKMDENGIIHVMRRDGLDEAPGAYNDIDFVMQLESDLVKPIVELLPMAKLIQVWRGGYILNQWIGWVSLIGILIKRQNLK